MSSPDNPNSVAVPGATAPGTGAAPGVAVEAVGVSKRFGATTALADAGISITTGETHALVGRNGAGKSTLVSILTGLQRPDSGEVRFGGEAAPPLADRNAWRRRVACVYQKSTIIPTLSVAENLFLNRQTERGPIAWRQLRRRAGELLDEFGLAVDPGRLAGDLNVEQRQLVEIARALSTGARFIILDEPTAQARRCGHRATLRPATQPVRRRGDPAVHLAPPPGGVRGLRHGDRAARRPVGAHPPGRRSWTGRRWSRR